MTKTLMTILISVVAACGGSKKPDGTTTGTPVPTSAGDSKATCVEVMTKNRECTSDFIPALVDIRAKYNNPEGIADAVKADRDKVISQALAEWATDSKDEGIASTCEKMAPATTDADAATAKGCVATAECAAYVACISPMFDKQFAK